MWSWVGSGWLRWGAPAVLGLVALAGCATSGSVEKLEAETRANRAQLTQIARGTEELRKELAELRTQIQAARQELGALVREEDARRQEALDGLGQRLAATEKRAEALAGAIRGVEMSVGGLSDQVARLEATPGPPQPRGRRDARAARGGGRVPVPAVPPEELFGRALESFKSGDLGQAILDFEEFLAKHPTHGLAGAAQFWIGEAYYTARDYQHAIAEYKKAVDIAPKGEKTPEALLKTGLAYRALRRSDRAREAWTQLVRDFPQTEAAQKARAALREVTPAVKPATAGPSASGQGPAAAGQR
ncbi:MAG: tol-pal system protein YbgF [Candidatus Rokubacteria bacterium]|nr:tol-pal system protein YbgF [Candidatus Rokubacteria bacterium]